MPHIVLKLDKIIYRKISMGALEYTYKRETIMKVIPLFDRVVIKPEVLTSTTKSGIVLPSTSQERPQVGNVIAVGNGVDIDANNVGMQVRVGDKVLFNKFAGSEIKVDEDTLIVIRQVDLIAIMEEINE